MSTLIYRVAKHIHAKYSYTDHHTSTTGGEKTEGSSQKSLSLSGPTPRRPAACPHGTTTGGTRLPASPLRSPTTAPRQQHHAPGLLLRVHLDVHVLHPEQQVAHHVEEAEQVSGVGEAALALVDADLERAPRVDHLRLLVLDLQRLVARVGDDQRRTRLLHLLHLQHPAAAASVTW